MAFQKIGVAKEIESLENPQGLEKRVALIPNDVRKLCDRGLKVAVETGAGDGIGFEDRQYLNAGAKIESPQSIYEDKDLVVKFKGPSIESIPKMRAGCTLFCMAHIHSFPKRKALFDEHQINVVAMELIVQSPKIIPDEIVLSKRAMADVLKPYSPAELSDLHIGFIGWSPRMVGAIRRAGNRNTRSLTIHQEGVTASELTHLGRQAIYFYDSFQFDDESGLIPYLRKNSCQLFDLKPYEDSIGDRVIEFYRETHPPFKYGARRIECLHETGQAGARYGLKLLQTKSPKKKSPKEVDAVVLGYGNVAMGAIRECYDQGVRSVRVLNRLNTKPDQIGNFLKSADLVVNGAEQAVELRGKNFLVTADHVKNGMAPGSVIIDLVGGSPTNRSAVESVLECTYLSDPYFEQDGILISALWGWPMMGMMRESAIRYSSQITDVLIGREKFIEGIDCLAPGVKPALVAGPY